jgi:nucleoid-associated protein YgaU
MLEMGNPKNSSPRPGAGNGNGGNRPGNGSPGGGGGKPGNSKPGGSTELYTVERGDSLSIIAGKYWNDVLLWPAIWDVPKNQATIGDDWNQIDVGMKLQIPDIGGLSSGQIETLRNRGKNWK